MDTQRLREEKLEQARAYRQEGSLVLAKEIYIELLKQNPSDFQVVYFLGMTYWLLSELSLAQRHIKEAIDSGYREDTVLFNYGLLLHETGQYSAAADAYIDTLSINSSLLDANNNLGLVFTELGETAKAIASFNKELKNHPENVLAMNNLANMLRARMKFIEAEKILNQAIQISPKFPDAQNNLGNLYMEQGKVEHSLEAYKCAIELSPETLSYRQDFCNAISRSKTIKLNEKYLAIVKESFDISGVEYQLLAPAALHNINNDPRMKLLLEAVEKSDIDKLRKMLADTNIMDFLSGSLFRSVLKKTIVTSYRVEKLLTMLRNVYLQALVAGDNGFLNEQQQVLIILAFQCFNNEYVYYVTKSEERLLAKIIDKIENDFNQKNMFNSNHISPLLVIAMYIPLYQLSISERVELLNTELYELIQDIIEKQILEVKQEQNLKNTINRITEINASSLEVMSINEDAPYPRWLSLSKETVSSTYTKYFNKIFPSASSINLAGSKVKVLVAGCGTGKHAIQVAQQFSDSDVLAVDLSQSSLAYASRMSANLGVENIQYAQADILGLKKQNKKFHHIDCFGVLHHFQDPAEGLDCLASTLLPNGTIRLGLYSEIARRFTINLRKFVREHGYAENKEGVRQARKDIFELPRNEDIATTTKFKDFYTASECRYLLFGAQDNCSTVPLINQMLQRCNLKFLGFILSDKTIFTNFKERFPDDSNMINLDNWEIFEQENPDTFMECYDFWCQKIT